MPSPRLIPRFVFLFLAAFIITVVFPPAMAAARDVDLAWDANTEPDLAGYRIYYGPSSGKYDHFMDVGNVTAYTLTGINERLTYYIAATALDNQGNESGYSNEVVLPPSVNSDDRDGDGLANDLEALGCTNPDDSDSDDDGVSDGFEDTNYNGKRDAGETNPCRADSDRDGLQDGTELSYTLADAATGTKLIRFRPDQDPATATDPLDADTDDDGLRDGLEDANRNGRLDDGETDPLVPNGTALFRDEFNDAVMDGDPDWLTVSGKWRGTAAGYFKAASLRSNRVVVSSPELAYFTDGRLDVDLALLRKGTDSPNAGIIFHYLDSRHYRYVRVKRNVITIGQAGEFAGDTKGVKGKAAVTIGNAEWRHLRLDVNIDGTAEVYLDGNQAPTVTARFAAPVSGKVGLRAVRARALFDNFASWDSAGKP